MTTCTPSTTLAATIAAGCGENVFKCYQCKRCTTGCPVAPYADMHPAQIMRAVQLGQSDMIFDDKFLWLCTGCETCTTPLPAGHRHRGGHGRAQDHRPPRRPRPGRRAVRQRPQAQLRLASSAGAASTRSSSSRATSSRARARCSTTWAWASRCCARASSASCPDAAATKPPWSAWSRPPRPSTRPKRAAPGRQKGDE